MDDTPDGPHFGHHGGPDEHFRADATYLRIALRLADERPLPDLTLYEETVEHGRYCGQVVLNGLVGEILEELGRRPDPELRERALEYAGEAVERFPSYDNVANYSTLLLHEGRVEESLRSWEILLRNRPDDPLYRRVVRRHLRELLNRARSDGDEEAALRWTERLEELNGGSPGPRDARGEPSP